MTKKIDRPRRKPGPAMTTGKGELVAFRAHADLLAILDRRCKALGNKSRADVIRLLIQLSDLKR